jgi:hypothetical protein
MYSLRTTNTTTTTSTLDEKMVPKIEKQVEFEHPVNHGSHLRADLPSEIRDQEDSRPVKLPIVWKNVLIFIFLHVGALYGLYACLLGQVKTPTLVFAFLLYLMGGLGITAGAHRLWAHRTYKATLPLRVLLALFQTIALQVTFLLSNLKIKFLKIKFV